MCTHTHTHKTFRLNWPCRGNTHTHKCAHTHSAHTHTHTHTTCISLFSVLPCISQSHVESTHKHVIQGHLQQQYAYSVKLQTVLKPCPQQSENIVSKYIIYKYNNYDLNVHVFCYVCILMYMCSVLLYRSTLSLTLSRSRRVNTIVSKYIIYKYNNYDLNVHVFCFCILMCMCSVMLYRSTLSLTLSRSRRVNTISTLSYK